MEQSFLLIFANPFYNVNKPQGDSFETISFKYFKYNF